jgi:hypothetical protein
MVSFDHGWGRDNSYVLYNEVKWNIFACKRKGFVWIPEAGNGNRNPAETGTG